MKMRVANGVVAGRGTSKTSRGWNVAASCRAILMAIFTLAVKGVAIEQVTGAEAQRLAIRVRVYTYTEVSAADLAVAERVATKIYREAGVDLSWVECPKQAQPTAFCRSLNSPTEIFVRVVPDFARSPYLDGLSMGYALATPPPDRGYLASISYVRVKKQLLGTPGLTFLTFGQLLGVGIAHEMGHLLLGTNSHSPSGLMCAHWNARELMLAAYGQLNFSATQAEAIRTDVQARMRDQASRQPAAAQAVPPVSIAH